jgi:UDP-N-acetylmuramoylalanine--D-glutamate ligase
MDGRSVMNRFSVTDRRVVVVGAARSGLAAADLLRARGAIVTLADLQPRAEALEAARLAGISLEIGAHRPETFTRADLIVVSPGVSLRQPALEAARRSGVPVMSEIELAWRFLRGRVIAVTGTKGKSTTTTLIGRMLEAAGQVVRVSGNIGNPLCSQVAESTSETRHVVEVSSFQLEATETFRPWIAVLLNLSPDHLDRHATLAEYAEAKARVFANQRDTDWAVANADDPTALALGTRSAGRLLPFSQRTQLGEGLSVDGGVIVHRSAGATRPLVPLSAVHLPGTHLLSDVMAAAAASLAAGAGASAMTQAVDAFSGLEHALERVAEIEGVTFVNDSKATNVEAARLAIESFRRPVVPILGGRFKGGDLRDLREAVGARASTVVAIGEAAPLVHAALDDVVLVRDATTLGDAVRLAFEAARPSGTVLLAPACASFDMFHDYAERGRTFKEEVARLREGMTGPRER